MIRIGRPKVCLMVLIMLLVTSLFVRTVRASQRLRDPRSYKEIKRNKVILQNYQYSCGAAALAMLLNRFEGDNFAEVDVINFAYEKSLTVSVKKNSDVTVPPLNLRQLENFSRRHGYEPISFKASGNRQNQVRVLKKLSPMIARIRPYGDITHFVLVEKFNNHWVQLADPSYGRYSLPVDEFLRAWKKGDWVSLTVSQDGFDRNESTDGTIIISRTATIFVESKYYPFPGNYSWMTY